jgi:uncharacterized protein with ParB-like and HNH nuclease domain
LCALRDCLDENSASRIQEVYLTNRFRDESDILKFVPTQADRDIYNRLVLKKTLPDDADEGIGGAYRFFIKALHNKNDYNIEPRDVLTILEKCLQVVMINLSNEDDPYLIFESLNFKGEPLNQADLVRNYLLMRFRHSTSSGGEQERVYQKYWIPLENELGSNLPEFLRHYLMKNGDDIKQGGIYAAIKAKLKDMPDSKDIESEVQSMQRFGGFYAKFLTPELEQSLGIKCNLENIKELKVTTSYPLLLRFFDAYERKNIHTADLEKSLGLIESFIVRRAICGLPTNALNKLFIQWAKSFPNKDYVQWLHSVLSTGSTRSRFPNDSEFSDAFLNQAQYGKASTRFVLCRLEKSFRHKEIVDLSSATIEHILPETLTPEWVGELGVNSEMIHAMRHRFGNLTLTSYNSELSNLQFNLKKERLKTTHIELNRWVLEQKHWGASEIENRANFLLSIAKQIWLAPLDSVSV